MPKVAFYMYDGGETMRGLDVQYERKLTDKTNKEIASPVVSTGSYILSIAKDT